LKGGRTFSGTNQRGPPPRRQVRGRGIAPPARVGVAAVAWPGARRASMSWMIFNAFEASERCAADSSGVAAPAVAAGSSAAVCPPNPTRVAAPEAQLRHDHGARSIRSEMGAKGRTARPILPRSRSPSALLARAARRAASVFASRSNSDFAGAPARTSRARPVATVASAGQVRGGFRGQKRVGRGGRGG
jgi:hypothetical protein